MKIESLYLHVKSNETYTLVDADNKEYINLKIHMVSIFQSV